MKKLLALTICFIFAGVGSIFAEPLQEHTWELGTEISHITYDEPGVMKEKGMMYGFLGSYVYRGKPAALAVFEEWMFPSSTAANKWMFKAEGRFSFGQVDYKNSGTLDNIDDYIWEFRGLAGYDFPVCEKSTLTPYIGIGYRYLNDDMSGMITSTGALGYERESSYIYSPIGVEIITPLENDWSVGAMFEYDIFWKGKQKSHIGSLPGYSNDLENKQKNGYGFRGSIKLQKKGEKLDFVIEPFIRYWNIKKSEDDYYSWYGIPYVGWEPKNNSTEFGIKFAAKF